MKRATAFVAALAAASFALVPTASAALEIPPDAVREITGVKASGVYVVLLAGAPAVTYAGDLPGLPATAVAHGAKLDIGAPAVRNYVSHLTGTHDEVLRAVGADPAAKLYDYTYAGNGFAVALTALEAARVAAHPAVLAVFPDEIQRLSTETTRSGSSRTTDSSASFLDLDHQQGPWASGYTGEGTVVGVIDTGIWPEHPSFADAGLGPRPTGYTATECAFGSAVPGAPSFNDDDADFACNNKLLAAKVYGLGFHGSTGDRLASGEYLSARDASGHGSHTASIAAGNPNVQASVLGADWGTVSGVAPRAAVAAYKACWSTSPEAAGCATSDLVAAIDDAVADGVDVINYSVGSSSAAVGPDDVAFLFAAAAGVLVAGAAGNEGPDPSPGDAPAAAPWMTTVAAATRDLDFGGTVILGDGTAISGMTLSPGTEELPVVDAAELGNESCDPGVEFTDSVAGAIVLCHGGEVGRLDKSRAIAKQDGAAMILADADDDALETDNHHVPSLHVTADDGEAVADYIETEGAEAVAILSGGIEVEAQGSVIAASSSRGPNRLSEDIITPDVTAPGVDVLAAQTPTPLHGASDQLFQALSGTSMSSPHVAGVYALLRQAHPEWTPAMAKSALMSTSRHSVWKEDGTTPAQTFDMGSGYIQPGGIIHRRGSAFNPGLVYDAGLPDYTAFLCGADLGVAWETETCESLTEAGFPTDPSDLNIPSIGVAELSGSQTVTRTVTSVADKLRVFESKVKAPAGFSVQVDPPTLTLAPGESAAFTVTFTRTRAQLGEWSHGSLAWTSAGYRVVSPIALRAVGLSAPDQVSGEGLEGEAAFDLAFGYDGAYEAQAHGLVAATAEDGSVPDDPENDINSALASGVGVVYHWVDVPEGTAHTRISLSDELTAGDDDLDLYVFAPNGDFLTGSGSGTSAEQIDFVPEEAGQYTVAVHGWQTDGPETDYTLTWWSVPAEADGSSRIKAMPSRARTGATGTVVVTWDGLEPDTTYLGAVSHSGGARGTDPTQLAVTLFTAEGTGPAQTAARVLIADRIAPVSSFTRPR